MKTCRFSKHAAEREVLTEPACPVVGEEGRGASGALPLFVRVCGIVAAAAMACVVAFVVAAGNGNVAYARSIASQFLASDALIFAVLLAALAALVALARRRAASRRREPAGAFPDLPGEDQRPFLPGARVLLLEDGALFRAFQTVTQAVWLATLSGVALCLVGMLSMAPLRLDPGATATLVAVLGSLVMLTAPLMLFEAGVRHLYSGLFVVAAIWGCRSLALLACSGNREKELAWK